MGAVASVESKIRQAWSVRRRCRRVSALRSSFAGFRFPPDVITLAVRWYLRYGLSYRDVEELLAERGITVDQVRQYRWVAGGLGAGQQHRPGGGDVGEKGVGVKPSIQQYEHARSQQPKQPPARLVSSRSLAEPRVAPSSVRVPVSAKVINRSVGYPAKPIR
jgi:hypothetical protein